VLRNVASVFPIAPADSGPSIPASEELGRLRKATLYADIIEAGRIDVGAVEGFTEGQWAALALIAKGKPPSPKTCALIRKLLHQRQEWRELVARGRALGTLSQPRSFCHSGAQGARGHA
jgi:hypothetical protein